jgi:pimeloyl-ACP methyl ester carboxylesterase
MTTAPERTGSPIRTTYRRYARVRTRVLTVERPEESRSGVRFVMFHGYCDSADTWRRLLLQFAEAGEHAVAVDLPGFGEADALRPGPILPQLDTFVRAVVREQAKLGEVVLIGNSLGGTVSLRAAQRTSPRLAGVVSIAAPGLSDTWLVNTVKRYPLPLRLYGSLPLPIPSVVVRGVVDAVVPRLLYATPRSRDDEDARRFIQLFRSNRSVRERLAQARQLTSEFDERLYEPERITSPLLILACGRDRLVRADSGRMLHSLVPHSRLVVHDDWGHCPQLDHAAEVHELVRYFVDSSRRAAAREARRRAATRQRSDASRPKATAS